MGQRHQIYVIAKIGGPYRAVGGVYRQWGYGYQAVCRCLKFIDAFHANASRMRPEILAAKDLPWEEITSTKDVWDVTAATRYFPITSTVLMAAGEGSLLTLGVLPTKMDNNDGITVLDITDMAHIRYALTPLPGSEHVERTERLVPLDAEKYMQAYTLAYESEESELDSDFDDENEEEYGRRDPDLGKLWKESDERTRLANIPLIDLEDLQSAWPEIDWYEEILELENAATSPVPPPSPQRSTLTLRETTMHETIMAGLGGDPADLSWLYEAEHLPDFVETMSSMFQKEPSLIHKPSGLAVLKHLLGDKSSIDLSFFPAMTTAQVLDFVKDVTFDDIVLTLPELDHINLSDVDTLLSSENMRELHMGGTPNVPLQQILDLCSGKELELFTHPDLYRLAVEVPEKHAEAVDDEELFPKYPTGTQAGYPVTQILHLRQVKGSYPRERLGTGGLKWTQKVGSPWDALMDKLAGNDSAAYHRADRERPKMWDMNSDAPIIVLLTLRDSLLSLDQLLLRLPSVLEHLVGEESLWMRGFVGQSKVGKGIANSLAQTSTGAFLPVPAELFSLYATLGTCSIEAPPPAQLPRRGEWTLLVLQNCLRKNEPQKPNVRYAFVTLDEKGKLLCMSVKDFEKTLRRENSMYEPRETTARAELVRAFHDRWTGVRLQKFDVGEVEFEDRNAKLPFEPRTVVDHCNIEEAREALLLVQEYNDQLREHEERFGQMRLSSREDMKMRRERMKKRQREMEARREVAERDRQERGQSDLTSPTFVHAAVL